MAEKTMLNSATQQVRVPQLSKHEMTEDLTGMVEDMTGRHVVNYQSQVLFDPDMSLEIFVFDPGADEAAITATATAQLEDAEEVGRSDGEAPTEDPSTSGQEKQ